MRCQICPFYHSGRIENHCDLTSNSNFATPEECSIVDDKKRFKEDWPELGFVKGESALEFVDWREHCIRGENYE